MKKKIFILLTALILILGLTSCGADVSYDDYNLEEYVKVGKYKGLKAEPYSIEVTDKEIKEKIDTELEAAKSSQEVKKGETLVAGDVVNIDYVGKMNGKKFDGGSAEGQELELGSGAFISGFEDGLIGKKVGDKVKLNLIFPEDYGSEDLAGKPVVFNVTINSASRSITPEYDIDFVKNTTKYNSIKEYEASIEKELYNQKEEEAISNQQAQLWSEVLENSEVIKYPERELNYYMDFNSKQIDEMAESYQQTREEMLANYEFGDEEEFQAVNEDSSKLRVKQEMIIEYIADKENIEYTDKEVESFKEEMMNMGYDEKAIKSQTGSSIDDYARMNILYKKVLELIQENAVEK